MYKILIVDDEEWIRRGIIAKLEYNGFQFSWAGEASNGDEALDIIRRESPHIVITDIRMNNMDGIELIRAAMRGYPKTKFIIITGYSEFEYAEQALNMGVLGYILKPVTDQNIKMNIDKAIALLDKEHEIKQIKDQEVILVKEKESLKQERILNQVLHSSSDMAVENTFNSVLGESANDNWYMLALFHIDSSNYYDSDFKYQDLELIKFAIKNIMNDIRNDGGIRLFDNHKDINQIFALICGKQKELLHARFDRFIFESFSKIGKFLKISITISVSEMMPKFSNELYKQVKTAYDLRFTLGSNKVFRFEDFKNNRKYVFPEQKFKLFQSCLETYDLKNIEIALDSIFHQEDLKEASGVEIRLVYNEIINTLLKVCNKMNIDTEQIIDADFQVGEVLNSFGSIKEIVSYIYTTILALYKVDTNTAYDCRDMMIKVKDYIDKNYFEELSVKELSQKFAISPNYLSAVFKKETGESIKNYIMKRRVENACIMLKSTGFSIADISLSIGYADDQYFYRIFKKATGMTPFEYRNSL